MSQSSDDKSFEEYLGRESQLSKQYRTLGADEVPAELDRRILAQAQAAVSTAGARKKPAWVRLSAPLALAASMVLVVSIVIESGTQHEVRMSDRPAAMPPPAPEQDTAAASESLAKQEPATSESKRRQMPAERHEPQAAPASKALRSLVREKAEAPSVSSKRLADADLEARINDPLPAVPAPPVEHLPEPALVMITPVVPPAPAALYMPQAEPLAKVADVANSAELEPQKDAGAARDSIVSANNVRYTGVAAPGAEQRGTVQSSAADKPSQASFEAQLQQAREKDPKAWLEYIRHLRRENKGEQADGEWKRFHQAYPRYEVDEKDTARAKQ